MKSPHSRVIRSLFVGTIAALAVLPAALQAQSKKKNPASKLYVSDVAGEAQIDTGDQVEDLNKRSVYTAQGVVIETKRPEAEKDRAKAYSTMVYSNGTGAFFDADTRVEIRKFFQEPFVPTRSDSEVEPSISQTQAFIARGTVGLCTSKLVAGSTMAYTTPHGTVSIRGQKVVIQTSENITKISMLDGESTVRAGALDLGGQTIHAGEQAIIRPAPVGQPNMIEIVKIPNNEAANLDDKIAMACMAKKTVYFEVRGRQQSNGSQGNGEVEAFNSEGAPTRTAGSPFVDADGEIVAVPVVPANLPVQFTISPASLESNSATGKNGPPGG